MSPAFLLVVGLITAPVLADERAVDVFVIAGQSNATGQGVLERLPAAARPTAGVRMFHSDALKPGTRAHRWISLRACSEDPERFGLELGFARRMSELRPDRRLALIKHALSGSSLRRHWYPGLHVGDPDRRGPQLRTLSSTVREAMRQLHRQGERPVLRGILWQQGEAEARSDAPRDFAEDYDRWLGGLLVGLREEWGTPELALVYGEILPRPVEKMAWRDDVRAAQRRLDQSSGAATSLRGALLVEVDDLSLRGEETGTKHPGDLVHFGTEGIWELGRRMAERWVKETPRTRGRASAHSLITRDATGWRVLRGRASFDVPGTMQLEGRPLGLIRSTALYEDFVLEWEFRLTDPEAVHGVVAGCDGAPGLGARRPAGDFLFFEGAELRPWPAWNRGRLACRGLDLELRLDGGAARGSRRELRRDGCLGFVAHHGRVELRAIEILPSPGEAAPDWRAVLPWGGEELSLERLIAAPIPGWQRDGAGLVAQAGAAPLSLGPAARDFVLSFDYRLLDDAVPRLWPLLHADGSRRLDERGRARSIECPDAGDFRLHVPGLEGRWVQFWSHPAGSGAVLSSAGSEILPVQRVDAPPGEWNRCELRGRGRQLALRLGGRSIVDADLLDPASAPAPVALIPGRGRVEVTNVYFRSLSR